MNSFIGWIGGKRALRSEILAAFPDDVGRYIEVFGGAGWVLFGKDPTRQWRYLTMPTQSNQHLPLH